jgi:hypothetical protein
MRHLTSSAIISHCRTGNGTARVSDPPIDNRRVTAAICRLLGKCFTGSGAIGVRFSIRAGEILLG